MGGVEHFTNLRILRCRGTSVTNTGPNGQLEYLDVSNNTALSELDCSCNNLATLDLSNNSALSILKCSCNLLTGIDLHSNIALTILSCYSNKISYLDVSDLSFLEELVCAGTSTDNTTQLSSLNISGCTKLKALSIWNRSYGLTSLDVSNNTELIRLICVDNRITSLDLTNNTALETLQCDGCNELTTLDVSNNTALTFFDCYNCPKLSELWLRTGQTFSIQFTYNQNVTTVYYKD